VFGYEQRTLPCSPQFGFDGTPETENWETFKSVFGTICGGRNLPDDAKLVFLLDKLQGQPRQLAKLIAGTVYDTNSYIRVWQALEEQYGGKASIQDYIFSQMNQFPPIKTMTSQNVLQLRSLLQQVKDQLGAGADDTDNVGFVLRQAKRLIPFKDLLEYNDQLAKNNLEDKLARFIEFLDFKRRSLRLSTKPAPFPSKLKHLDLLIDQLAVLLKKPTTLLMIRSLAQLPSSSRSNGVKSLKQKLQNQKILLSRLL
jgi:hypothetical protein